MTAPRIIVPGASWAITRRCAFRKMFWTPLDEVLHQGQLYALAAAQQHTGVGVHACSALPNHGHWTITGPEANLPEFTEYFFRESSKFAMNALRELGYEAPQNIWDARRPHVMRLMDVEAQLVWQQYVITQAVDAGIVAKAADYPGFWTDPGMLKGTTLAAPKPPLYFGDKRASELPLVITPTPLTQQTLGAERTVHWLRKGLRQAERACRARGGIVLGAEACKRQHPWAEPKTPRTGFMQRIPSFMVATRGPEGDTLRVACAQEVGGWRRQHEDSRRQWKDGDRSVQFPFGTYAMRVRHGAHVEAPPAKGSALVYAPGPGIAAESVGVLDEQRRNELHAVLNDTADLLSPEDDTLAARLRDNESHTVERAAQPHPARQDPATHPPRRTVTRGKGRRRGRHLPEHGATDGRDLNPLADIAGPEPADSAEPLLDTHEDEDARDDDPNPPPT